MILIAVVFFAGLGLMIAADRSSPDDWHRRDSERRSMGISH